MSPIMSIPKLFLAFTLFISLLLTLNVYIYAQDNRGTNTTVAQGPTSDPQPQASEEVDDSQTQLGKTADGLKWFFTVLVYPALVGGVFLLLLGSIFYVTGKGRGFGYVRRATGALLPFLLLTFMLLVTDKGDDPIREFFVNRNSFIYLFAGIAIGVTLVEFGKYLIQTDDDRRGSIYNLFLSAMVVFLLYSIMKGFLDKLIYFLFAMIMAGGMDIVFGKPLESSPQHPSRTPSPKISSETKQTVGQTEKD